MTVKFCLSCHRNLTNMGFLFYRARIEYAAHLVARKQFLMPKERTDFYGDTYVPLLLRQILFIATLLGHAFAFISAEVGIFCMIYFFASDTSNQYGMIRSLVIAYLCVGAIFNLYVLSAGIIVILTTCGSSRPMSQHTGTNTVLFLKMAISLFHGCLGINEDRTVDEGVFTVSEDVLIKRGKK